MQKIVLNVIPDGVCPKVYVNQFDIGRQFQIKFKEDSITYDAPNGVTVKINGRKADNHVFEYTESDKYDASHYVITKSGSGTSFTVIISTTEQMTAAAGDAEVQLTLKDSANRVIGTLNFILAVQERPASVGDPSETDLPDIVRSVNGITPDADGDVQLGATGTTAIGAANISTVENTRIMQSAHTAGSYVYVAADDQLYYIVSTIGAGGTLTPGTNAISTTVTSQLTDKADFRYLTCSRISRNNLSAIESDLLSVFNSMTEEGAIAFVSIYANYSGSFTNGGRAPAICYKATSSLFGVYVFVGTVIKQGVYNGSTWSWN